MGPKQTSENENRFSEKNSENTALSVCILVCILYVITKERLKNEPMYAFSLYTINFLTELQDACQCAGRNVNGRLISRRSGNPVNRSINQDKKLLKTFLILPVRYQDLSS